MLPVQNVQKTEKSIKFSATFAMQSSNAIKLFIKPDSMLGQSKTKMAQLHAGIKETLLLARMAIPKPSIAKLIQYRVTANADTDKAELLARFFAGHCSG